MTPANAAAINARLDRPRLPGASAAGRHECDNRPIRPRCIRTRFSCVEIIASATGISLEARYSFYQLSSLNARGADSLNEVSNGTSVYDTNHTFAVSNIATLSPRTFNETRGQFIYDNLYAPPNDQIGPAVTISGVATFGRFYRLARRPPELPGRGRRQPCDAARSPHLQDRRGLPLQRRHHHLSAVAARSLLLLLAGELPCGHLQQQGFTQNFGTPTVSRTIRTSASMRRMSGRSRRPSRSISGVRYDLEFLQTINTDMNNVSPRVGFAWSPLPATAERSCAPAMGSSTTAFHCVRWPMRSCPPTTRPTPTRPPSQLHLHSDAGRRADVSRTWRAAPPAGALENFSTMQ